MAGAARQGTDKRLGLSITLGALAAAGAVAMLIAPGEVLGAWGFATAILTGVALIVTLQIAT